ncbi:MAG: hypothetical protein HRT89_25170 [Lentisphaeria bacterium]|nr:hypothetical protein [Lentisphaeria bacterium]NQZ71351.1 hypothetical protein [Lentisphaeria bacterium]
MKFLYLLLAVSMLFAKPTPLSLKLKGDATTLIECNLAKPIEKSPFKKALTAPLKGYHYNLYIPANYTKYKTLKFPVMFISSPTGKAGMTTLKQRLIDDHWIVVMLIESKEGDENWLNNFLAAHDDVMKRCRIAKNGKFAAGLGEGARYVSSYPLFRKGFQGIFCHGAGFYKGFSKKNYYKWFKDGIKVAMSFDDTNANAYEAHKLRRDLNKECKYRLFFYKGENSWAPTDIVNDMMNWMNNQIFAQKDRDAPKAKASKDLFFWHYSNHVRRAKLETNDQTKYQLIKDCLAISRYGRLSSKRVIRIDSIYLLKELEKIVGRKTKLKEEIASKYNRILSQEESFLIKTRRGNLRGDKLWLTRAELKNMDNLIRTIDSFIKKYPDTALANRVDSYVKCLKIEKEMIAKAKEK